MIERTALFTYGNGLFHPANKHATAACSILSRMTLTIEQVRAVRSHGYTPRLTNGQEIGRVDERA